MREPPAPPAEIVVFLGPSLPLPEARRILAATYRPPARRGDLDAIAPGVLVGLIDGVFGQTLAVSPREVHDALRRGVRILGASSMGALRATEVPGVEGVGRIYEMFRDGLIDDDDEVALVFDAEGHRPLSEPMVNVRYAVDRLVRPGTLEPAVGARIVAAAKRLHYPERVYPRILRDAGVPQGPEALKLAAMLRSHDLKREDAILLLEELARASRRTSASTARAAEPEATQEVPDADAPVAADAPVYFWEYGERVPFLDLVRFLKCTGRFEGHARSAVARFLLQGNTLEPHEGEPPEREGEERLALLRRQWGLASPEELAVTFVDIGLRLEDLSERLVEEVDGTERLMALAREGSEELLRALRVDLVLSDLALKRETVRLASLRAFAARGRQDGPLAPGEISMAERRLCQLQDAVDLRTAAQVLARWGVSLGEVSAFVEDLAFARRAGRSLLDVMEGAAAAAERVPASPRALAAFGLRRRLKAKGSRRFCVPLARALAVARRLCKIVGVTRVAMVTGLSPIAVPIAHAFRPEGTWSSTVGGGKSESPAGARVGAIMEEVEKWAQEQFRPEPDAAGSYARLRRRADVLDPARLALPHDSRYAADLEMDWIRVPDLLGGRPLLCPFAAFTRERLPYDIFYSPRAGRKLFSSNGLASGLTLEEAVLHAICELVERHASVIAEVSGHNPGDGRPLPLRFVDLRTAPPSARRLAGLVERGGFRLEVLDITSEIRVPTFQAFVLEESPPVLPFFGSNVIEAKGTACHPDPEVALGMAILEACQTVVGNIAGAREDLTLKVRSLGRSERTGAETRAAATLLRTGEGPVSRFEEIPGFVSRDVLAEIRWTLGRIADAGFRHVLVADLTRPEAAPARVVRALIPGFETVDPFCTGPRARVALLRDLLPTHSAARGGSPAVRERRAPARRARASSRGSLSTRASPPPPVGRRGT